jgi:hypothetical protein
VKSILGLGLHGKVKLVLEILDGFLVLLAEHVGSLLGFHVDVLEELAQLLQFRVTLLVRVELTKSFKFTVIITIIVFEFDQV